MGKGGGNKGQLAMFMRNSEWNEYRYQIIAIGVLLVGAFARLHDVRPRGREARRRRLLHAQLQLL